MVKYLHKVAFKHLNIRRHNMESIFLGINWRFFAKTKEMNNYLIVVGRFVPNIGDRVPVEILKRVLISITLKKIEQLESFNGNVCEDISELKPLDDGMRVVYQVKFKTMEELMRYRKEVF